MSEKKELTIEEEFDKHTNEAFGAVAISAVAWILMFIYADGYEMLGESPVMVIIAIFFHAGLLYMIHSSSQNKNPTLAVIALSVLVLEYGLGIVFGFSEATSSSRGTISAGTGLAIWGLWNTIKAMRFLVKTSKLSQS